MLELDGLFKNALSSRAAAPSLAEEACRGSNKEAAATLRLQETADTKGRRQESLRRGNERGYESEGAQGEREGRQVGRQGAKKRTKKMEEEEQSKGRKETAGYPSV